jgi:hypothetical protein
MSVSKQVPFSKFNQLIDLQKMNGTNYSVHLKGGNRSLMVDNRLVCITGSGSDLELGSISDRQFVSFLASFKRGLYAQIRKKAELHEMNITFDGLSRSRNIPKWNSLETSTVFWNIDLSSAYWQIGYRLGYLTKSFYDKYIENDDFKQVKRLCFSFLARENVRQYFVGEEKYEIRCDNSFDRRVYDNVRHELYKIISKATEVAGNDCIEYNIDGVTVTENGRKAVERYFRQQKLLFKTNKCVKLPDGKYLLKNKIRKF